MFNIKRLVRSGRGAAARGWSGLSKTQQLMIRGLGVFTAILMLGTLVGSGGYASADEVQSATYTGTAVRGSAAESDRGTQPETLGQIEVLKLQLARADAVLTFSARYRIPADLTSLIYDTALGEGIDPELAFRLVHLESRFRPRATSHAEAYGLAQVQVATARFYKADVTVKDLYDPEINLRIGFRYLRDLLERYGDVKLALLAYNRGPTRVQQLVGQGRDPENGYATQLMEGYYGTK